MSAPFNQDLNLDASCDSQFILTCYASDLSQLDISAATSVTLEMRVTTEDAQPLITLTGADIVTGIAPPVPEGLFLTEPGPLAKLGPAAFAALGVSALVVDSVADIAALEALPTTNFVLSNVVFVATGGPITGGSFYQWSLADTRTPDASKIVAGAGATGNWLLFGTMTVNLTAAAAAALVGWDSAVFDVLVTWASGAITKLVSGRALIEQTV
jgi:hypothetical protein